MTVPILPIPQKTIVPDPVSPVPPPPGDAVAEQVQQTGFPTNPNFMPPPVMAADTPIMGLDDSRSRQALAESIGVEIDDWCAEKYNDGHRKHLGGSVIGKPCSRQLWYSFRHVKRPTHESENSKRPAGQVLRLYQRGHREEPALTEYLEGIGCKFDYTKDNQQRVSDCGGHFGGSLDNVGTLPPKYGITEKILFEFKTSNMSEFNKLKKEGVKSHRPEHWSQMCVYGYKANLRYAMYVCVDKNTDEIYIELLQLDWEHGKSMIDKAGSIITARVPPPKIALSATHFSCKWCEFKDICHFNAPVEKNCRSCQHAVPLEEGKWGCELYGPIPDHIVPIGCASHDGVR